MHHNKLTMVGTALFITILIYLVGLVPDSFSIGPMGSKPFKPPPKLPNSLEAYQKLDNQRKHEKPEIHPHPPHHKLCDDKSKREICARHAR